MWRGVARDLLFVQCSDMARHSNRQALHDEHAFLVRVKIAVPDCGLWADLNAAVDWLAEHVDRGGYACHSMPDFACDTFTVYFRTPVDARAFVSAFPMFELADGTLSPAYRSAVKLR